MWPFKKKEKAVYLGEFCKVKLVSGDVVVLTSSSHISDETALLIDAEFERKFGKEISLMILDAGMKLAVLSPEKRQAEKDAEALEAIQESIELAKGE